MSDVVNVDSATFDSVVVNITGVGERGDKGDPGISPNPADLIEAVNVTQGFRDEALEAAGVAAAAQAQAEADRDAIAVVEGNVTGPVAPWNSATPFLTGQFTLSASTIWVAMQNNTNVAPGSDGAVWQRWIPGDEFLVRRNDQATFAPSSLMRKFVAQTNTGIEITNTDVIPTNAAARVRTTEGKEILTGSWTAAAANADYEVECEVKVHVETAGTFAISMFMGDEYVGGWPFTLPVGFHVLRVSSWDYTRNIPFPLGPKTISVRMGTNGAGGNLWINRRLANAMNNFITGSFVRVNETILP